MKQYHHVFGVDVSKKTVDITHVINQEFTHRQFSNDRLEWSNLCMAQGTHLILTRCFAWKLPDYIASH